MNKSVFRNAKGLPLALLLAAGSSSTLAAINPGTIGPPVNTGSGSSGELFLSVWDQAAATSYSYDMGLTVEAFIADATTARTWVLDQRFIDFAATGDTLTFNIAGSNGYPGITTGGVINANYGFLASHLVGAVFGSAPNNASLGQIYTAYTGHIQYLNNSQINQNGGSQFNQADQTNYPLNLSEVTTTNSGSYFNNAWGVSMNAKIPWMASAKVRQTDGSADTTLDMYFVHANPAATNSSSIFQPVGTGFVFSLDPATATLSWASTAPVPVPAAVWLFLSALAGLGLFKRPNRDA